MDGYESKRNDSESGQPVSGHTQPIPRRGMSPTAMVLLGMFAVAAVVLLLIGLTVVVVQRSGESLTPSPVLVSAGTVVLATTTAAPTVPATAARTPLVTSAITATSTVTSAQITQGGYVEVYGTGTLGLRLRLGPGLNYATNKIFDEGTRLKVAGGPERTDDIEWWRLESPTGAIGWAAREFLRPVSSLEKN